MNILIAVLTTLAYARTPSIRLRIPPQRHCLSRHEPAPTMHAYTRDPLTPNTRNHQLQLPHRQRRLHQNQLLIQVLAKDKEKAGKAASKEKFTRFSDLLEEIRERHHLARVLEDDEEKTVLLEDEFNFRNWCLLSHNNIYCE